MAQTTIDRLIINSPSCRTISRTVTAHLSRSRAGGSKRLPLLLFGLGIVLVIDLRGLLLYNEVARVALIREKARTTILTCLGRQK